MATEIKVGVQFLPCHLWGGTGWSGESVWFRSRRHPNPTLDSRAQIPSNSNTDEC